MKQTTISIFLLLIAFNLKSQIFQQTSGMGNAGPVEGVFAQDDLVLASVAGKLYRSTDAGQSFDYISVDGNDVTPRCFAKIDNVIILGGIDDDRIYRSTDEGQTWDSACTGCPAISGFPSAVPFTADTLAGEFYMCGTNFVRKSSDLGLTWETMDIDGLCLDISSTNGELWATPSGNLHQSLDQGASWQDVPDDGIFFSNASQDVLVSDGRILVATSLSAGNGLYISDNGGTSYTVTGNINLGKSFLKINSTIYFTHLGGFSRSEDNGDTWTDIVGLGGFATYNGDMSFDGIDKIWMSSSIGLFYYDINTEEIGSFAFPVGVIDEVSLSTNYTFGIQGNNLFRSNDAGATWNDISTNLGSTNVEVSDVYADGSDVYVLANIDFTPTYLYSSDEGNTFDAIPIDGSFGGANQVLSFNPVVVASNQGVLISNDNGQNFTQANLFDVTGMDVADNFIANGISQNENSIYVTGIQGSAYSHNMGDSWTYIQESSVKQFGGWENRLVRNRSNSFPPFVTEESSDGGATWETVEGLPLQFTGPEFMWMMNDTLFIQNDQSVVPEGQIYFLSEDAEQWEISTTYGAIPSQIISAESDADGRVILGTDGASAWILDNGVIGSVESFATQAIRIYPNPANALIHFGGTKYLNSEVIIYDALGIPVLTTTMVNQSIDISALKNGIYVLSLPQETGIRSIRFVKN